MATSKQAVETRIAATRVQLDEAVKAQEDFVTHERQHRIIRRRVENRLREANPKLPAAAIELLLESDSDYLAAFVLWKSAQTARKRADGEYEIAKMAAWAAIRAVG